MSNPNIDLEDVITDAVNDAQISEESPDTSDITYDTDSDTSSDTIEASVDTPAEETPEVTESSEVTSPATKSNEPQDEFERLAGIPAAGVGGRENRIPYSRVKKITEKAVSEVAEAVLGRKLVQGEKAVDVVKAHVARLPELESKVTDYEGRLDKVGEFEHVMANEPQRFLQILARIPAYAEFFQFVEQAYNAQANGETAQPVTQPAAQASFQQPVVSDGMPEPDEELSDGSKVYSMDGLKGLLSWNASQVEGRVRKQIEERYKPMESEWAERRRIEATLPVIRAQIAEAKTWPLFNESEAEITQELERDQNITLEAAYRKVVFPKLVADRTKMRQDVIRDIKAAPTATSVSRTATRPSAPSAGPRSMEDVIRESIATLKR